ncbi:MAG: hypothetical protein AVDCRST_MAG55-726, partial [uncultured Rubrobacteraceae bacterium]
GGGRLVQRRLPLAGRAPDPGPRCLRETERGQRTGPQL